MTARLLFRIVEDPSTEATERPAGDVCAALHEEECDEQMHFRQRITSSAVGARYVAYRFCHGGASVMRWSPASMIRRRPTIAIRSSRCARSHLRRAGVAKLVTVPFFDKVYESVGVP